MCSKSLLDWKLAKIMGKAYRVTKKNGDGIIRNITGVHFHLPSGTISQTLIEIKIQKEVKN